MERVLITRPFYGLAAMQVCAVADATDQEILAVCNTRNPWRASGWSMVVRDDKEHPNCNPVQCEEHPDRLHILVYR